MMTPTRGHLGTLACASVAILFVLSFAIGFFILPSAQSGVAGGWWTALCRAAGFEIAGPRDTRRATPDFSSVVIPPSLFRVGSSEQIGRGATLALRCTMCHGAAGLSAADSPNLAGQYAEVVYKQLIDYQRGARANVVMTSLANTLSEQNVVELAHYYAYLPKPGTSSAIETAPVLVRVGDPMRNIAPCGSCHGHRERKAGSPWLNGEPRAYLEAQLLAFKADLRRNDVNAVMRSVAHRMTSAEISEVARYYASLTP